MEFLRLILIYLHLVAFALLFGAWVVQWVGGHHRVSVTMRAGLGGMFATGLLLAIPFPAGIDLDYVKLAVKLGIALLIGATFGVAITRDRSAKPALRPVFLATGVLILLNAAVAVFWQ